MASASAVSIGSHEHATIRAMAPEISDPRTFPARAKTAHTPLIELAEASLAETSAGRADALDRTLTTALAERLESGDALLLAELIAAAPSVAIARQLWRRLIDAWRLASRRGATDGVAATLFAVPVVVIAATRSTADTSALVPSVAGVLSDTARLAAILLEHRALASNDSFGLADALVAADAVDVPRLSELLAWQRLVGKRETVERDLPPTPIAVQSGQQSVHLRFLIGTTLGAPDVDVLATADGAGWALALAGELARQLALPEVSVLALPRTPQSPPAALQQGRAAQREVGAQLFASNAIRKLRATVGEPSAVISAHRCLGAPGGGELRLSLSSPFDPRQAEGFRCPLFPTDPVADVASMLVDLLRDCRVADVRVLREVHPDRDPQTGVTLLFKSDAFAAASTHRCTEKTQCGS
ncbi:MAG: hypothetical protein M3R31_09865 [Pseudomonadota bacterium]|nr:hypothetical protein [Pseudomonadota bacterium]